MLMMCRFGADLIQIKFLLCFFLGTFLNFCLSETPIDKSELTFEEKKEEKEEKEEEEEKEERKDS